MAITRKLKWAMIHFDPMGDKLVWNCSVEDDQLGVIGGADLPVTLQPVLDEVRLFAEQNLPVLEQIFGFPIALEPLLPPDPSIPGDDTQP